MAFQAPRGTHDVLPSESHLWRHVEATFCRVAELYGYKEIRTPVFEEFDLFVRTSGDTSEVVTKQMYDFMDKGDRHIALKPEGTAPAMRAYLEHNLAQFGSPTRVWYNTPVYRYERPQKGRYREHHQLGAELIGSTSPLADAEIIDLVTRVYAQFGVETEVLINCIGRAETRSRYRELILAHVDSWLKDQDEEGQIRALKNPLRLLDTKDPSLKVVLEGLPDITTVLEDSSKAHFDAVLGALSEMGIKYRIQSDIVRGLDYYTDTVFEIHSSALGAQGALCGGGRYDNLIESIGGPSVPSVGFGMGIERAMIALADANFSAPESNVTAYLVSAGDECQGAVRNLAQKLRNSGVPTGFDLDGKSMKSQFKSADRSGAQFAGVIGGNELANGTVTVKDLQTGDQQEVKPDAWIETLRNRLS